VEERVRYDELRQGLDGPGRERPGPATAWSRRHRVAVVDGVLGTAVEEPRGPVVAMGTRREGGVTSPTTRRGPARPVTRSRRVTAGLDRGPVDREEGGAMGEASRHPLVWSLMLDFDETDEHTDAIVTLCTFDGELKGWGRARRNPTDPNVPRIGENLAAARALADLSHKLVDEAAHGIEAFEGHPVLLYR
jgi:hypothetical protein